MEAKLHNQYQERRIEGDQACRDRLYAKEEQKLTDQIKSLKKQIDTETLVNATIKKHLTAKQLELQGLSKARDAQREKEGQELEAEKLRIQTMRQTAEEEFEEVKRLIADDDEFRARLAQNEKEKEDQEQEKI